MTSACQEAENQDVFPVRRTIKRTQILAAPMNSLRFVTTSVLILCLSWVQMAVAQTSSDASVDTSNPDAKTVGVDNVTPDEAIAQRLRKIFESAGYFTDLQVGSESGIITLRGIADNDEHRDWETSVTLRTQDVIAAIDPAIAAAIADQVNQAGQPSPDPRRSHGD